MLISYDPQTDAELTLAAEIVGFSLHALDALGQSADPEITAARQLRLRGSAVSLSREAHKAERKLAQLRKSRTAQPQDEQREIAPPQPIAEPAPQQAAPEKTDSSLTWTQAYHQRQRDRALAKSRARAEARMADAVQKPANRATEPASSAA